MKSKVQEKAKVYVQVQVPAGMCCWSCGEAKTTEYIFVSDNPLLGGECAKICETCVRSALKTLADYKFTIAINGGATNVTKFRLRARRRPAVPTVEALA